MRCATCRQDIGPGSRYVSSSNRPHHEQCYRDHVAPRCGHCDKPILDKFYMHERAKYHEGCFQRNVAEKCAVCGTGLTGKFVIDPWGYKYHEAHRAQFPACDACGRLTCEEIGGGGFRLGDGRYQCKHCQRTAVRAEAEALRRFNAVRVRLEGLGMALPVGEIPLRLVGRNQLTEYLRRTGHPTRPGINGCTHMESQIQGNKVVKRDTIIYMLRDLPADLFDGTAAHELGHAWAFLSGCPTHDPTLAEGSCNYLRWLVHKEQTSPEADYYRKAMLEDPDPAYGHAFRIIKSYAERKGFPALLTLLQRSRQLPLFGW